MQLRARPRPPASSSRPAPVPPDPGAGAGSRVLIVHRVGALAVAGYILVFGVLGFADGLDFFSTEGGQILGMSSNGLLSTISVVTAAVLVAAAVAGPRPASTVMITVGALFLLAALAHLAVLRSSWNVLAFEMSNVGFSAVTGLFLLVLGAYGRISGHLPPDSPYARPVRQAEPVTSDAPATPAEVAAERAMRDAEIAVVTHTATPEQLRRVQAMARVRTRADRRRVWLECEATSSA